MPTIGPYDVIDFILNTASESDLDVIRAALRRREEPGGSTGALGVDVGRLARESAAQIGEQLGGSVDQIRSTVRDYVRDMIAKQAPELSSAQLDELLNDWVPEGQKGFAREAGFGQEAGGDPSAAGRGAGVRRASAGSTSRSPAPIESTPDRARGPSSRSLPSDVVMTMVRQFVAYGTGAMSVSEEMELKAEMPDWHDRYWQGFPSVVRKLLTLFLKGAIGSAQFWSGITEELGIGGGESEG